MSGAVIDISTKWLITALSDIGVYELVGPKSAPRVVEYFAAAHSEVKDDDIAWCSAFMNWVFRQVGIEGTAKLNARSWLEWGVSTPPVPGAVAVFPRNGGAAWQGHVTMIVRVVGNFIDCVGGNQRNSVNITRYKISEALGFRWPKNVPNHLE